MRIPIEWLNEFIDLKVGHESLAHMLTMAGLEVEAVEEAILLSIKGTCEMPYVFEVNVTPNRPDCLSIAGIAREVRAITGAEMRLPDVSLKQQGDYALDVEIIDRDLCHRYAGRIIKGVRVSDSPEWLKKRLEAVSIRPINNIVDITNYVLMELGQPLHAFDLDLIRDKIIVKRAGTGASITTLDGIERKLPSESLIIADAERPIAVAGVMGGLETSVTDATVNIFLESAWFSPYSVRRTSKALGLRTESSYRFERGVDIEGVTYALDRATALIVSICGGTPGRLIDVYPKKFLPAEIKITSEKINRVLGTEIAEAEMIDCLKRLGMKAFSEEGFIKVIQPSFRPDILHGADVIEEVARIYGYGRIPTKLPRSEISVDEFTRKRQLSAKVKTLMRMQGYDEAINYSFLNSQWLNTLALPSDDRRRRTVKIKNPLRAEDSHLRTTLLPSLIENFRHNFFRGLREIKLFEVSRVFIDEGSSLPKEEEMLAAVYCNAKPHTLWKEQVEEFYVVKGSIEALFSELKIKAIEFEPSSEPFLHPGKSADVTINGKKIGFLGVLSPTIIEAMDIKQKVTVVVFELNLGDIIEAAAKELRYEEIPRFPFIERDIALIVDDALKAEEIISLIKSYPSEFIEYTEIFDLYKGSGIAQGRKSLAFSIRYRAKDRTLTDEEVDRIHSALIEHLIKQTGGQLRT